MREMHEIVEGLRQLIAEYDRAQNAPVELKTAQLNVKVRPSFHAAAHETADRLGISVAELVERAVVAYGRS